jgi:hypothetical protein
VRTRLDAHDGALNMNTRELAAEEITGAPLLASPDAGGGPDAGPDAGAVLSAGERPPGEEGPPSGEVLPAGEWPSARGGPAAGLGPAPSRFELQQWFAAVDGRSTGPMSFARLKDLHAAGKVGAESLVWTIGMKDWQRVLDLPGLMEELL